MTAVQQMRIAGIRAQLALRGIAVTLIADGSQFTALAEHYQSPQPGSIADSGRGVLEPETRQACRLAILKVDLEGTDVEVGDYFRDSANSTDYRVTRVEPRGVDVLARFVCDIEPTPA